MKDQLKLSCIAISALLSFGNVMCSQESSLSDELEHSQGYPHIQRNEAGQVDIKTALERQIQNLEQAIENQSQTRTLKAITQIAKTLLILEADSQSEAFDAPTQNPIEKEIQTLIKNLIQESRQQDINIPKTNEMIRQILNNLLQLHSKDLIELQQPIERDGGIKRQIANIINSMMENNQYGEEALNCFRLFYDLYDK